VRAWQARADLVIGTPFGAGALAGVVAAFGGAQRCADRTPRSSDAIGALACQTVGEFVHGAVWLIVERGQPHFQEP
jgi:hypothetical protein